MLLGRFQPAFNVAAPLGGFVCAGEIVVGFQLGIDAIENSQCMRLNAARLDAVTMPVTSMRSAGRSSGAFATVCAVTGSG